MDEYRLSTSDRMYMTITSMTYKKRATASSGVGQTLTTSERIAGATTKMHASIPLPDSIQKTTSFNWQDETVSLLSSEVTDLYNDGVNVENLKRAASVIGLRMSDAALEKFGSQIIAQQHGRAADPMKEIFFNGLDYRRYNWTWTFQPENAKQASDIYDFCETLEKASTASRHEIDSYFDIPDSFNIEFADWLKLPKIEECVCTQVVVDFSSSAKPLFHSDGYPAFMRLSASFLETVLPLKD